MRTAKEILEYCSEATEGPLSVEPDRRPTVHTEAEGGYFGEGHIATFAKYENAMNDAQFYANARTDLPAVVTAAVELRRALSIHRRIMRGERFANSAHTDILLDATSWLEDGE